MATLCELADRNRDALSRRFEEIPQGPRRVRRDEVRDVVERDGRLSVNLKPDGLEGFLEAGRLKNRFEIDQERAAVETADGSAASTTGSGDWLLFKNRRTAFEEAVDNGEPGRVYYGALNLGGLGAPRYGHYCLVARRDRLDRGQLCWIAFDSLKGPWFSEASASPNLESLAHHVAKTDNVGRLAAVKVDEAWGEEQASDGWKPTFCTNADYVEGVFRPALGPDEVAEVRIDASTARTVRARSLKTFREPSGGHDEIVAERMSRMLSRLAELGIPVIETEPTG